MIQAKKFGKDNLVNHCNCQGEKCQKLQFLPQKSFEILLCFKKKKL